MTSKKNKEVLKSLQVVLQYLSKDDTIQAVVISSSYQRDTSQAETVNYMLAKVYHN